MKLKTMSVKVAVSTLYTFFGFTQTGVGMTKLDPNSIPFDRVNTSNTGSDLQKSLMLKR